MRAMHSWMRVSGLTETTRVVMISLTFVVFAFLPLMIILRAGIAFRKDPVELSLFIRHDDRPYVLLCHQLQGSVHGRVRAYAEDRRPLFLQIFRYGFSVHLRFRSFWCFLKRW